MMAVGFRTTLPILDRAALKRIRLVSESPRGAARLAVIGEIDGLSRPLDLGAREVFVP
jgi:hypothetical protein